jgi:glycosyltransferase involved in cell wall biosynthesis
MRLLYVTEGVPTRDPVRGDGSSMISFELLRHLPDDITVRLLTFGEPADLPQEVRARCADAVVLPLRDARLATVASVASAWSIGTHQRATRRARAEVRARSGEADVTLLHGPHVTRLARAARGSLALQVVDPWSLRVTMDASLVRGWRRWYRRFKASRAAAAERRLPSSARLMTVGRRDAQRWSACLDRPVRGIPNGVDVAPVAARDRSGGPPTVCFVGSLAYGPNVESAHVLVEEIAPLVWAELPGTRFVLAGRQPARDVLALAGDRVDVRANVPSVQDVFAEAHVAVFPDRHGLGVRNSVTEALAAGLPVVATPAAAREQEPSPLLQVSDSVPELVKRVVAVLQDGDRGEVPGSAPAVRTWDQVGAEYLEELGAASGR